MLRTPFLNFDAFFSFGVVSAKGANKFNKLAKNKISGVLFQN